MPDPQAALYRSSALEYKRLDVDIPDRLTATYDIRLKSKGKLLHAGGHIVDEGTTHWRPGLNFPIGRIWITQCSDRLSITDASIIG